MATNYWRDNMSRYVVGGLLGVLALVTLQAKAVTLVEPKLLGGGVTEENAIKFHPVGVYINIKDCKVFSITLKQNAKGKSASMVEAIVKKNGLPKREPLAYWAVIEEATGARVFFKLKGGEYCPWNEITDEWHAESPQGPNAVKELRVRA